MIREMRRDIPSPVRWAVQWRCRGFCEDCGARRRLELHHVTYRRHDRGYRPDKDDDRIFGYETPEDLVALCRECHHARHVYMGYFWADIDELSDTMAVLH
jgi:5-methylcytosine-specific restriction endonuclease McrA